MHRVCIFFIPGYQTATIIQGDHADVCGEDYEFHGMKNSFNKDTGD